MRSRTNLLMTTVILLTAGTAGAYAADKDEMIKNAMSENWHSWCHHA